MQTIQIQQSTQELCQKIDDMLKNESVDEALNYLNDSLKLNPNSAQALILRGKILLIKNLDNEAICDLNQAIKLNPFIEESFYHRSTWFMKKKMWKESQQDCEQALKINPNYALAYTRIGKLMIQQGKNHDGLIFLKQALELDDKSCFTYFNLGNLYFEIEDYELALSNFTQVIKIDNKFTNAYECRGMLFWKMGYKDKAMKDFDQVIELDPTSSNTYACRAILNEVMGEDAKALIDFNKVIELTPDSVITYYQRGLLQMKMLKIDEKEIAQILQNKDFDQKSDLESILQEFLQGELQSVIQAIEDFSKAIELHPQLLQAQFCRNILLGMIEGDQNKFRHFIKIRELKPSLFDKIIDQDPNESEEDENSMLRYFICGKDNLKVRDSQKPINVDYKDLLSYFSKESICKNIKKQEENLRELNKKIELDPNSAQVYNKIGKLLMKQGNLEMALETLNKAIELDPKFVLAFENRARLFTYLEYYLKALQDYQEALKIIDNDQENVEQQSSQEINYQCSNQNQQDYFQSKSLNKIKLLKNIQHGITQIKLEFKTPQKNQQQQTQTSYDLLSSIDQQLKKQLIEQQKCNNNQEHQQNINVQLKQINEQLKVNSDINNSRIYDLDSQKRIHNEKSNNSILQLEIQQDTSTIDYQDLLKQNRNLYQNYRMSLDRSIFYLLKNFPDLFTFNEQESDYENDQKKQLVLENGLLLGQGSSGQVYYTINPKTNKPAALKVQSKCTFDDIINKTVEFKLQYAIQEIYPESIIGIQGKIIIKQYSIDNYKIYAYLDLGLGSLSYFRNKIVKFTESQIDNIYDCILDSIIKLHISNTAHGDIKLENIINTSENGWVLADLGSAIAYYTPYGDYPIVGTMAYLPKYIRKARNNNNNHCKMNIFKKDIYAFQLTMLQIIYYNENFYKLQKILDEQQRIHPKINQLYNKDLITIKAEFMKRKFTRKQLIKEFIPINSQIFENFNLNQQYEIELNSYIYLNKFATEKKIHSYLQILLSIQNIENIEYRQKQMKIAQKFYKKYSPLISAQEIFDEIVYEHLTKLEYDLYFDIFSIKGSKTFQLMICQGYQSILQSENYSLKLQEAEILYIMGNWDDARIAINSIQNEFELENDEQILKLCLLKARLNNQWIEANEDIIHYIRNYKEPLQMLIEWELIIMDSLWIDKSQLKINIMYQKQKKFGKKSIQRKFDVLNYIPKMLLDTYNFEMSKKQQLNWKTVMKQMQLQNYDNYSIFYSFWMHCELWYYDCQDYGDLIRVFIEFIEENLQEYYFKWIAYDQFAQYLTYIKDYKLAHYYFDRVLELIKNDCPLNQYQIYYHLWRLEFKEKQQINWEILNVMINILKKMPNSNLYDHLTNLWVDELNSNIHLFNFEIDIYTFSRYCLEQEDIKTRKLRKEVMERLFKKNIGFQEFEYIVQDLLPKVYDRSGVLHNFDIDLIFSFASLAHFKIESEFSIIKFQYLVKLLQSFTIFQSINPTLNFQKLINEHIEFKLYIQECSLYFDEQRSQEAVNMYNSYLYNAVFY